jgi:hypothetical protein
MSDCNSKSPRPFAPPCASRAIAPLPSRRPKRRPRHSWSNSVSKYQYRQSDIYLLGTDLPIDSVRRADTGLVQQLIESGLTRSDTA